jgi:hypothetical protein
LVIWAPVINAAITSLAFAVAAFAFRKTWLVNDFNLCRSLSEEIERRWGALQRHKELAEYEADFVCLLNHYERVCMYLNNVVWFKTRSYANLKMEVIETLRRHWDDGYFQECLRKYMSSDRTYSEMRLMMTRAGGFRIPK